MFQSSHGAAFLHGDVTLFRKQIDYSQSPSVCPRRSRAMRPLGMPMIALTLIPSFLPTVLATSAVAGTTENIGSVTTSTAAASTEKVVILVNMLLEVSDT